MNYTGGWIGGEKSTQQLVEPWADSGVELHRRTDRWRRAHPAAVACRHHYQGIQSKESVLRATEYRQMAGRAGRAGIDTQGEAILLANNPQLGKQLLDLMQVSISSCDRPVVHGIIPIIASIDYIPAEAKALPCKGAIGFCEADASVHVAHTESHN